MDPLSVAASIIALLQAANAVISVCYDYRSALTNSPWALVKAIEEVRDLRNVLESLEGLANQLQKEGSDADTRFSTLRLLCSDESGPLQSCQVELDKLQKKLLSPKWSQQLGRKRRALIQAFGWQVKDSDVRRSLQELGRYKATLNLALSTDQAYV